MRKKILITGLGYISTELCKLYPSSDYEVTVIDNQIFPDRIFFCAQQGIKFIKRDIFDLKDLLQDVDTLIHTSGITLVPQRLEDENEEISEAIYNIGTLGTREIIKNINPKAKLVFLSSHVLYEGNINLTNINEEVEPKPILSYPKSKYQSELDLYNSDLDFVVLRLGSVYGYNQAIRYRIVTNLFPLKTALGEKITVTGSNVLKPIVGVSDVAECIKFLGESNYSGETYHVISDHRTVKELAEICKEFVPNINIDYSNDKLGSSYSLDNGKVLSTGFKFKQNIRTEIFDMIQRFSYK